MNGTIVKNITKSTMGLFVCVLFVLGMAFNSYGGTKVLKIGHVNAPTTVFQKACELFKDRVEEKTNGSLKVEIYPAGQLGGTTELVQGMTLGTVACYPETDLIFGSTASYYKLWGVYFLFKSMDEVKKFKEGPLQIKFEKQLINNGGIRQLGYFDSNFKWTVLSKKPLYTIDDLKGLKIRCPQIETMIRSWNSFDSHPVGIDWGEVYTSLSTNLVHAVDNQIADMWHEKFNEVTKYHCLTYGMQTLISWNFSEKIWQSLSSSEQKAISQTVEEIRPTIKSLADEDLKIALDDIEKKGISTIKTEREPLANRIGEKINYILSDEKELIDMYWQIRKGQSK